MARTYVIMSIFDGFLFLLFDWLVSWLCLFLMFLLRYFFLSDGSFNRLGNLWLNFFTFNWLWLFLNLVFFLNDDCIILDYD